MTQVVADRQLVLKYLQAASKAKREAQAKLVEAILPVDLLHAGGTPETVAPLLHPD